jgi:hypothetical protein
MILDLKYKIKIYLISILNQLKELFLTANIQNSLPPKSSVGKP